VGEKMVILEPEESLIGGVTKGINIDDEQAVVVRDLSTGQVHLVTQPQVFVPTATEEVMRVTKKIKLEDYQTAVLKESNGSFVFKTGLDKERSFFLEPFQELMVLVWSRGIHKDKRERVMNGIFDSRPKFTWYEFEARTKDNVELVLGITMRWEIQDVRAMIQTTSDAPGDICSHARSTLIEAVSTLVLQKFLESFNSLVQEAMMKSDKKMFFNLRGIAILGVEVRSIMCKDPKTQIILQEIIQQNTNRISALQKQESENEVNLKRFAGNIETEKMRGKLLEIQQQHLEQESQMEGKAEGLRLKNFMENSGESVRYDEKMATFQLLRKKEIFAEIGKGNSQLYFTPSDVDLKISTKTTPDNSKSKSKNNSNSAQ